MRFSLIIIILIVASSAQSQGFRTRFNIPQSAENSSREIFESSPGNYIAAGFAVDTSSGIQVNRITMMGLGNNGQLLWTKKYGNIKLEYLNNGFIQRCFYKQNSHLYYAGCARDSTNKIVGLLIKFALNGDTIWQKIYRDTSSLEDVIPQMVTGSVDGGFLITGFFQNWSSNPYARCLLIKTDAQGKELWRKKISKGAPDVQDGKAIIQDSASKKIVIVGYQYLSNNAHYDHILVVDSLGNKVYQGASCFPGGMATDVIQTKDKKIIMVGWQYYSQMVGGSPAQKSYAVKFDINAPATAIWKINGYDVLGLRNGFTCAIELPNTNILIGGSLDTLQGVYNGLNIYPANILTRLTVVDKNGNIIWNRYYDYKTNDSAVQNYQGIRSLNLCQDGGWVAAIEGFNYGVDPMFFVKYDSTGCDSTLIYCQNLLPVGSEKNYRKDLYSFFPIQPATLLL